MLNIYQIILPPPPNKPLVFLVFKKKGFLRLGAQGVAEVRGRRAWVLGD